MSIQQTMHLFIQTIVEHKALAPLLYLIPESLAVVPAAWLPAMVHSSLCTCGHSHRGRPYSLQASWVAPSAPLLVLLAGTLAQQHGKVMNPAFCLSCPHALLCFDGAESFLLLRWCRWPHYHTPY